MVLKTKFCFRNLKLRLSWLLNMTENNQCFLDIDIHVMSWNMLCHYISFLHHNYNNPLYPCIGSESFRVAHINSWIANENIVMHRCTGGSLHP
jgi:hypothetical protein